MGEREDEAAEGDHAVALFREGEMVAIEPTEREARKAAWLAERRTCITATDVAKILGFSKFGGPIDVYLDKIGELPELDQSAAPLAWGRRMEPIILQAYHEECAPLLIEPPYTLRRSVVEPLIGATLDACRVRPLERFDSIFTNSNDLDGRPGDAKNVRHQTAEWGDDGTDRIPLYYATQLVVQMFVVAAARADLAQH